MPAPAALPADSKTAIRFEALAAIRLAEPFERLRDRSDALLAKSGKRPSVFLANLGTAADFTARSTFARSLFEAGGIAAIEGKGAPEPTTLAADYTASGAALVCLCSSDKVYATDAVAAARILRAAGARHIYLAGRAGEHEAEWRAAGIDAFIFAGGDAVRILEDAYTHLE
jgi:methylmalonyl-CoA mutase